MNDRIPYQPTPCGGLPVPVVIPAWDPPPTLIELIGQLRRQGFGAVVVVDDGSADLRQWIFDRIAGWPWATVLHHAANQGKGAALRTGLAHVLHTHPTVVGAITLDADGQHRVSDAVRLANALRRYPESLILGSRRLTADAPLRSRLGNAVARRLLRVILGVDLGDTQCGLRAIPRAFIPALLPLLSRRYEFELEMLIACRRRGWTIREVPIQALYIAGNAGSHFRPVRDSARIGWALARNTRPPPSSAFFQALETFSRPWKTATRPPAGPPPSRRSL
jgi:dolichol-phosphate mannosyltransferase